MGTPRVQRLGERTAHVTPSIPMSTSSTRSRLNAGSTRLKSSRHLERPVRILVAPTTRSCATTVWYLHCGVLARQPLLLKLLSGSCQLCPTSSLVPRQLRRSQPPPQAQRSNPCFESLLNASPSDSANKSRMTHTES